MAKWSFYFIQAYKKKEFAGIQLEIEMHQSVALIFPHSSGKKKQCKSKPGDMNFILALANSSRGEGGID